MLLEVTPKLAVFIGWSRCWKQAGGESEKAAEASSLSAELASQKVTVM